MKYLFIIALALCSLAANGQNVEISLTLNNADRGSENPYIALWVTDLTGAEQPLLLLRDKVKWVRDLKLFWRKIARENRVEVDAITGATLSKKSMSYQFDISEQWHKITVEVVREHGKREVLILSHSDGEHCQSGHQEIAKFCLQIIE